MSRYSRGDEAFDLSKIEASMAALRSHTERMALAATILTVLAIAWSCVVSFMLLVWIMFG